MSSRGMVEGQIVIALIAVFVLGIVSFAVIVNFDRISDFTGIIIPSFGSDNRTSFESADVVGVRILKGNSAQNYDLSIDLTSDLVYHDGSEWVDFPAGERIEVGSSSYSPEDIRMTLGTFYFFTPRLGNEVFPYSSDVDLRVLYRAATGVNPTGLFRAEGIIVFEGEASEPSEDSRLLPSVSLGMDNQVSGRGSEQVSPALLAQLVAFRDQIVAGGQCEKFVEFGSNFYKVHMARVQGETYLFVNLSEPTTDSEKYSSCVLTEGQ